MQTCQMMISTVEKKKMNDFAIILHFGFLSIYLTYVFSNHFFIHCFPPTVFIFTFWLVYHKSKSWGFFPLDKCICWNHWSAMNKSCNQVFRSWIDLKEKYCGHQSPRVCFSRIKLSEFTRAVYGIGTDLSVTWVWVEQVRALWKTECGA